MNERVNNHQMGEELKAKQDVVEETIRLRNELEEEKKRAAAVSTEVCLWRDRSWNEL